MGGPPCNKAVVRGKLCSLRPLEPEGPAQVIHLPDPWLEEGIWTNHFSSPGLFPHLNKGNNDMLYTLPSIETIVIV